MDTDKRLYPRSRNPLLLKPGRPLPKEVAIVGAGTIGPDIGYYLKHALPHIRLYLVDVAEAPLQNAEKRLGGYVKKAVERRRLTREKADAVIKNIFYSQDYDALKNCDLVIESATEELSLKRKIFEMVEERVDEDAIIASNTSSFPAARIFSGMKHPERATVTHFFTPARKSLPVEIIRWEKGSPDVVDDLFWLFAATGKAPIITDDAVCFVLDRVFCSLCNEAACLLERATASQIDKVAEEFVSAGPFYVLNLTNGNPIIVEANTLRMEEGEHYRPASILKSVEKWKTHRPGSNVDVPDDLKGLIRDRLLGMLFAQSFEIIDRGIGTGSDLNFGSQVALGYRKGPFDVMREMGEAEVNRIMGVFLKERPGFSRPEASVSAYLDFRRYVLVDDVDDIKVLTIRRPQAMNAINHVITNEILDVLRTYANDPAVKGFVITGYGTAAFSAGADIGVFTEMLGNKEVSLKYTREYARVQEFMDGMEKPVVAAVNGVALGGGLEVAIRCHSIVAMETAFFQFPEITLGIIPGIGGSVVPYRKWPRGGAVFNDMICFGKPLQVKEAREIGMVSAVGEDMGQLLDLAVEEVERLAGNVPRIPDGAVEIPEIHIPDAPMAGKLPLSKEALAIAVETIKAGAAAGTSGEALEICYRGFADVACTDAAREGVSAFLQRRKPVFRK